MNNTSSQDRVSVAILAAGLGTRMKSRRAKVLHEAGGKPLVQHVVDTALRLAPAERIFVVVGHQEDAVRAAVRTPGVGFVRQETPLGTGDAVKAARDAMSGLGGLLLILYGDCPLISHETLERLVCRQRASSSAGAFITAELDDPRGYGRVLRAANGDALGVVEQKAATPEQLLIREVNVGIYCFRADLFWKHIGEVKPDNPAREYYLTDMVEILIRAGHRMEPMTIADPREAFGINTRVELAEVDRIFRDRKARELMLAGVTIERPETVIIDQDVQIGMDTIVGPFAQILGATTVGENCRIGACSIVRDSVLDDEATVLPFSIVNTSRMEKASLAGPFARLRMEDHLEEGAHVGNFVELKKTRLGAGSKAMHLAYLGDSTIGRHVNVGAGTITCNYDGIRKSPTHIADGAFVGSNSTLVAPLEIGAGAYIGAGSVVTDDVPADALALGRARQLVKEGWARARREKKGAGGQGPGARE